MSDPYLWLKWLHILSSTVLFGTGLGTAFQMVWAMRAGELGTIRRTAAGVVVADWLFTLPAGILQPLTGIALARMAGYSLAEPWLLATYALYLVAFVCWAPVVVLQIRIRDIAARTPDGAAIPADIARSYRVWFALGWPAFGALLAVFWLMVAKPVLW